MPVITQMICFGAKLTKNYPELSYDHCLKLQITTEEGCFINAIC